MELTLVSDGFRGWLVLTPAQDEWDAEIEVTELVDFICELVDDPPKCVVRAVALSEPCAPGVLDLRDRTGVALLFVTQNEMKMSKAGLQLKKAFYLAEAGLEDGRAELWDVNRAGEFQDDLEGVANDGTIDFDPDAVRVVYDADGNVTGFEGFGEIRLRYNPESLLPDGIPWPVRIDPVPFTYVEGGS